MARPRPSIDDETMIDAIRSADHFLVSMFVGRGVYEKRSARTVAMAMRVALDLEQAHTFTRRAMIYAVARGGHSTFLTDDLIKRLREISR